MTKRECLLGTAVQAAFIVFLMFGAFMIQPCEAQVYSALQQTADQVKVQWGDPVTGVAREINVGQKLRGIEALREQLFTNLSTWIDTINNKGMALTDQEVSELRGLTDKLNKFALYCRDLADRVQQQHPESAALTDWLRANELVLRSVSTRYISGTPITETRLLTDLENIERSGRIRSDQLLGESIRAVRTYTLHAKDDACTSRYIRALLGYTPAGVGVDVFNIAASPDSVPQGDPVHIGLTLSMLGDGDCNGQSLTFELQSAPGQPTIRRNVSYFPGAQHYDQNFFAIDTKGLQPGTYPVVATVSYTSANAVGGWVSHYTSKQANTSFVVTGHAAGPANPQPAGKLMYYSGSFKLHDPTWGDKACELRMTFLPSNGFLNGEVSCNGNHDWDITFGQTGSPDFTIQQITNNSGLSVSGRGRFEGGAPQWGAQSLRVTLSLTGSAPWNGILTLTRIF